MMKRISRPFWNPSDRRPRALWRLLLYVLLLAATGMALSAFLENLLGVSLESALSDGGLISEGSLGRELGSMVFGALAIVLPTLFAARFFDRRPVSDLGLRFAVSWWRDLCFGLFLGALLMLLIFLVELALGWITIEKGFYNRLPYPFWVALFSPLTLFLLVGIYEELMVRGYIMKNLAEGLSIHPLGGRVGMLLALLLSSALFGLLHARNPNASTLSTFGLFLAGLLLGLPVLLTDELAIPIGLHITWNFFQGNVFRLPRERHGGQSHDVHRRETGRPRFVDRRRIRAGGRSAGVCGDSCRGSLDRVVGETDAGNGWIPAIFGGVFAPVPKGK